MSKPLAGDGALAPSVFDEKRRVSRVRRAYSICMPELPEVESTVRYLRQRVEGLAIQGCSVLWKRTLSSVSVGEELLKGKRIAAVTRRGKYIRIDLAALKGAQVTHHLFFHLRMSGSLEVVPSAEAIARHDRLILNFSNGKDLRFNDPRKFGRAYLVDDPNAVVGDLGVEPLSRGFTAGKLGDLLALRSGAIKPVLLNQRIISGLGNIYVDEALWRARIHPLVRAEDLEERAVHALYKSIRHVLKEAIRLQGTDSGDGVVNYGSYRPRVCGREGKPCKRCRTVIERSVVGQRGTHTCKNCQQRGPRRVRSTVGRT